MSVDLWSVKLVTACRICPSSHTCMSKLVNLPIYIIERKLPLNYLLSCWLPRLCFSQWVGKIAKFLLHLCITKQCLGLVLTEQWSESQLVDLLLLSACFSFQIQHMYRCARVQGLDTSEGLLLFGKEHFYVIDGFTMTATREIRDIETLPPKWVNE